ncbi:MAG: HPr-like protein Crh [Lentisphaerae bacterium ADurb.BinA184]|nr:MAG: HPr-like protein Crh [Lentisphaerae bacterium ADurb.BinA184]
MKSGRTTVVNKYGIHLRPSTLIVREAQRYGGDIMVSADGAAAVSAKNVLGLLGLGLTCGKTVTVAVTGPDEAACLKKMLGLFSSDFSTEFEY